MRIVHSGHIGDILAFIPTFRKLGGTRLVVCDHGHGWQPMSGGRYESLRPLLDFLGIENEFSTSPSGDLDVRDFRSVYHSSRSLLATQALYCGVEPDTQKWIQGVRPSPETRGRVVVSRTPRYQNQNFPWRRVMRHLGDRALFIGCGDEHLNFQRDVGRPVEHRPVSGMLEMAELLAGADNFVHNQTAAAWLALGMRIPHVQECCDFNDDTRIDYPGAHYIRSQRLDIAGVLG
jgi:hypothetical protein